MSNIVEAGFEQAARVLGISPEIPEETPLKADPVPQIEDVQPPTEKVRQFLKENHLVLKTVVLPPQETWIGNVFIQTDKPLLGITYEEQQ